MAARDHDHDPDDLYRIFQTAASDPALLFSLLDGLPIGVEIFALDGACVFINRALCEQANITDAREVVGHYNILSDPFIDATGQRELVTRAFKGERGQATNVRLPSEDITTRYTPEDGAAEQVVFMDISCFPLLSERQELSYVAMTFAVTRHYTGKTAIVAVKEYLDAHWREPFDLPAIADAVGLSPDHLGRLFKEETGETLQQAYREKKLAGLKDTILDVNLSIAQAFRLCGLDYNGRYKQYFKDIVGMTPSDYRKQMLSKVEPGSSAGV